jgi:hypothetical protein
MFGSVTRASCGYGNVLLGVSSRSMVHKSAEAVVQRRDRAKWQNPRSA